MYAFYDYLGLLRAWESVRGRAVPRRSQALLARSGRLLIGPLRSATRSAPSGRLLIGEGAIRDMVAAEDVASGRESGCLVGVRSGMLGLTADGGYRWRTNG